MIDYDRIAADYSASRDLPPAALEGWREALQAYLPPPTGLPLLDLGAGTGTFTRAFVTWFGVEVIAVEPSQGMRREMLARGLPPGARLLHASAEELPLPDRSCGAAWLSTMIHHVRDLSRAAENLRRVVAPGGYVLVRSVFPDSTDGVTLFRFFPTARRVAESFPSVEDLSAAMAAAGFRLRSRRSVPQCSHPSLAAFHERVLRRAHTPLLSIPDEEYRAGLERLHHATEREGRAAPVIDSLDLVAFA